MGGITCVTTLEVWFVVNYFVTLSSSETSMAVNCKSYFMTSCSKVSALTLESCEESDAEDSV